MDYGDRVGCSNLRLRSAGRPARFTRRICRSDSRRVLTGEILPAFTILHRTPVSSAVDATSVHSLKPRKRSEHWQAPRSARWLEQLGELNGFLSCRLPLQTLQHSRHDQRQDHRSIHKDLAKFPTLRRRHKLSPRNRLAVRTTRKPAPIDRLRADAQSVVIALQGKVFPSPAVAQFDERSKLLRPVARNASADGENSQAFLAKKGCGKVFQVFERIEAEAGLSFFVALAVGQGVIETELRIGKRWNKYRNIFFICRLQNAALPFRVLGEVRPDGAIQLVR